MILNENYTLGNGLTIPKIALGTWQMSEEQAEQASLAAIRTGYRHIDTAAAYCNEKGVGRALKACGIPRGELFVTSKIPAEIKSYKQAKESIRNSLDYIGSEIDLILIHSPTPWDELWGNGNRYYEENLEVWKALEEEHRAGNIRALGVSNFNADDIRNILSHCEIKPLVNQICVYIGNVPKGVIEYCKDENILVEAYSPNATGRLKNNATVAETAKKYGVSVPRLGIRFCLQLGLLPLPKTVHEEYIRQNADVDFNISDGDMQLLLSL